MPSEHVQYYLNRIESQHQVRPRFMRHTETLLDMVDGAYSVIHDMPDFFNLETATGKQLDVIGNRVGASRKVEITWSAFYGNELDDDSYRAYIYSRIFRNHWDGTADTFEVVWDNTLGRIMDADYIDNQDMTATISVSGHIPPIIMSMILAGEIIPKPACVRYIVAFDNASATIIVSGDTRTYEEDILYVSEHTYTKPNAEAAWNPVWMYMLTHGVAKNTVLSIPAVQEIIQKFRENYDPDIGG